MDFSQLGSISTLHDLSEGNSLANVDSDRGQHHRETYLRETTLEERNIGLLLPALWRDLGSPSMQLITDEIRDVDWLSKITVAVTFRDSIPSQERIDQVRRLFDNFKSPVELLWINSGPVQEFFRYLEEHGVRVGPNGKGRTVWLSFGYMLAEGMDILGLHDCDITTYRRDVLSRLFYPAARFDYDFVKGYYPRAVGGLYGRVTRLLVWPLLRAFASQHPRSSFLKFISSFRYPLSGEFVMSRDLGERLEVDPGWGLEVGSLAQVHNLIDESEVAQVDLGINYDHHHQSVGNGTEPSGLSGMAIEIVTSLVRKLAEEGHVFDRSALSAAFVKHGSDLIRAYRADASFNGLPYDAAAERKQLEIYQASLTEGIRIYEQGTPHFRLPSWSQLHIDQPELKKLLIDAIKAGPVDMRDKP